MSATPQQPTPALLATSAGSKFVPIPTRYHPYADEGWRCFHCDLKFHKVKDAQAHFGPRGATPACQISAKELRKLERELARYREEDTDLHRQIRALECKHAADLRRAEESGYATGLRDGRALSANAGVSDGGTPFDPRPGSPSQP